MQIDHIAIWTNKLEKMKFFYEHYFGGVSGEKYINPRKNFESYFIGFENGVRIELMEKLEVNTHAHHQNEEYLGFAHFAINLGDRVAVDLLTEQLRVDGFVIFGEPRITGDGYYESVVLDPDGNKVELVA